MKKIYAVVIAMFFCAVVSRAQYVTIPDANFVTWLQANVPSAMSGNQMDTTNAAVLTLARVSIENLGINNIYGVQFFKNLITLDCGNGNSYIDSNHITSIPSPLASTLDTLICGNNEITALPALPNSLIVLECYHNQLTALPTLPPNLTYLYIDQNPISVIPALPSGLALLACNGNPVTTIPTLPSGLASFSCNADTFLTAIPALPSSLLYLSINTVKLTSLPPLPPNLTQLDCSNNFITTIPALPTTIQFFTCANNQITSIANLSSNTAMSQLNVYGNQLVTLPPLPPSLQYLTCTYNQLTSLPALPSALQALDCSYNQLTSLPALPYGLNILFCNANNISCFPPFPASLTDSTVMYIAGNPFTCLPNYVPGMRHDILAYPICLPGNPNSCYAYGVLGFTYNDQNSNCTHDSGDISMPNVHMMLYDTNNTLLAQTFTAANGIYDFTDTANKYNVVVDTANMPFMVQCTHPGADSLVNAGIIDSNVNFSLTCKAGYDAGVRSVYTTGIAFPATQHVLNVNAGDMSQWYGLKCATGDTGTVQITVSGPVKYVAPAGGALTPNSTTGNVFVYHIADFGAINNDTAFALIMQTDSSATVGDSVCVQVAVTPVADNNPANNTYHYCYPVFNSHDPNIKQVYPGDVKPGYNGWFTYTIHFQNTGTAAAHNIVITDTLDNNLDVKTFQLLEYSAPPIVSINGHIMTVKFFNINLPDSSANPSGSTGFVQYRIKPLNSLGNGTSIKNTAYIYFDQNPAVVTNTTQNRFLVNASVNTLASSQAKVTVYPNPNHGSFNLSITNYELKITDRVEIYNMLGEKVYSKQFNIQNPKFNINQPAGVYLYRIISESGAEVATGKFIIE